jgi:ECF sigma factor
MASALDDITALLVSWRGGDGEALNRLLTMIRRELRAMARRHLASEPRDHSMTDRAAAVPMTVVVNWPSLIR